jgi:hypothetical protein
MFLEYALGEMCMDIPPLTFRNFVYFLKWLLASGIYFDRAQ